MLTKAPVSFVSLALVFFSAGIGVGLWHYSERLDTKDGEIHRYRVALGIDEASRGALVELNNQELALKAQSIVVKLRQLSSALAQKSDEIQKRTNSGEIDKTQAFKEQMAAMKEVSQDFDSSLASDAYNVENELRKRLDPVAISHVVRVPALVADGSRVTVPDLFRGSGFDSVYIGGLADEIEQMAKLLPPDSDKR